MNSRSPSVISPKFENDTVKTIKEKKTIHYGQKERLLMNQTKVLRTLTRRQ